MKYFIDFEATQYSHEIISIGCVREDGQTFKSFVYVKPSKMSNFITQLTGITKEDVRNAPTSDEVFSNFYHWLEGDTEMEFYCYGDADIEFIRTNLSKTTDMLAISALSIIGTNLNDFAIEVKKYFGLHKMISLKKLVAYYRKVESIEQAAAALSNAKHPKINMLIYLRMLLMGGDSCSSFPIGHEFPLIFSLESLPTPLPHF